MVHALIKLALHLRRVYKKNEKELFIKPKKKVRKREEEFTVFIIVNYRILN